jgi:hypothetical protein
VESCYACENQATRQCRRCAKYYCELHGGHLCGACLSPASSLPSFNLYRGSLLVLLVGTAVALWLLVRPPGSGDGQEVVINRPSPTAAVAEATASPQATEATPAATEQTPAPPASTPSGGRTATPRATATSEERTYVVQSGDSLSSIADQFAPSGTEPFQYAIQIAAASGLASVDEQIFPGQILILP